MTQQPLAFWIAELNKATRRLDDLHPKTIERRIGATTEKWVQVPYHEGQRETDRARKILNHLQRHATEMTPAELRGLLEARLDYYRTLRGKVSGDDRETVDQELRESTELLQAYERIARQSGVGRGD